MTPPPIYYVHIMKTAGSAIGEYMRSLYPDKNCYPRWADKRITQKKISIDRILKLSPRKRKNILFYTTHMPAWVAEEIAPDHLHMTVLREPVARTVSHLKHISRALNIDDVESIYADPRWRARLSNYQVRNFALCATDHRTPRQKFLSVLKARSASGTPAKFPPLPPGRSIWEYPMFTAIDGTSEMTESHLQAALERIDRFDLVGVTDRLEDFGQQLQQLTGSSAQIELVNAAPGALELSDALLEKIQRDNTLDKRLYQHAQQNWQL